MATPSLERHQKNVLRSFAATFKGKLLTRGNVLSYTKGVAAQVALIFWRFCHHGREVEFVTIVRENQTCSDLRATISRHLLPPISQWGKTVDSYRRSCRNSKTSHRKRGRRGGFPVPEKGQFPLEKGGGGRRRHKMVTTIWCGFDSPWRLSGS